MEKTPISTGSEWTFDLINTFDKEISRIAHDTYSLDTYPNQIELISSEQMMDAYSSSGMPVGYHHWSYGKQFLSIENSYKRGQMGLAYEIVINSNPCISYLMEENTMAMQALVIAHACYGHNSFFKNNYLFTSWTDASAIIDYLVFSKNYIQKCEEKYGHEEVEKLVDSCHAVSSYGVDRYKRPYPISSEEEIQRQEEREEHLQQQVNELWKTFPQMQPQHQVKESIRFPEEPQENLLYFIEKNAPLLAPWQREIIRIVRKMAQYFYPQKQTKVMNEGWATFWHYTLFNTLYDEGLVNDGYMLEFIQSHTSVVMQPEFDSPYYSGINPYALGFNMFVDIKRICENPTEEDKHWFPEIAGSKWRETLEFAMKNFKDESFIQQFLSPKIIRDFKLFSLSDDDTQSTINVTSIHNEEGYRAIRQTLAKQYNLSTLEPDIQIYKVNVQGDRSLILRHFQKSRRPLNNDTQEVLKHIRSLWKFDVHLESVDENDKVIEHFICSTKETTDAAPITESSIIVLA